MLRQKLYFKNLFFYQMIRPRYAVFAINIIRRTSLGNNERPQVQAMKHNLQFGQVY